MSFSFSIEKTTETGARVGTITTAHGAIRTPAFVTVGTKGTVKGLTPEMLASINSQVVLANTYHLFLQPGIDIVKAHGGFGPMMGWRGPTMTDSGGFQVFSLGAAYGKGISKVLEITDPSLLIPERSLDGIEPLAKVGNDGVSFKSHIDGSLHYLTPERSMEIQHALGADIIFAFDECTAPTESYEYQKDSLDRTNTWAKRSLEYHKSKPISETQALFGIVQGGRYEDLRKKSAEVIGSMDFDGFGIGGSFAKEDMATAVKWVNEILPKEKPRHLLGIGDPRDLFMAVEYGCDLFDCVAPTRQGRTGSLYTPTGRINLMNSEYQTDYGPIQEGCLCYTCKNYTRSYLAHLFRAKEMLAGTLASVHNLYFINHLVTQMRQTLIDGTFTEFRDAFLAQYK
jgi:queuine tRNA-ribosyltransferase